MMSGRNRFPFTATQWQELEHQALIFKYMVSGNPIPPDLLFTVKSSLESSLSSKLILHQPQHLGWNCFQMGLGRKIDPEPGRCRRTDGKKWRCSKEAYPDSKYCERHMHRGRNRSRKPVETTSSTTDTSGSVNQNPTPSTYTNSSSVSSLSPVASDSHPHHNHPSYNSHLHHHFLYPHSSSSRPPGHDFSSQEINTHLLLDSSPCSNPNKHNRYGYGMKEEVNEQAFFSESSSMEDPWKLTPQTTGSSLAHLKQRSGLQGGGYPFLQHQGLSDTSKQQKNFFEMPLKVESEDQPKKVMHHFFDEWPKNKDSWVDSEGKSSDYVPVSTTQLSISIPNSSYDFFVTRNGN
ncbi:growth-regulating factor 1-like [Rhododendron vialii]|uniref:growth-regulating factor 1-like n=1 Tax=Rhododendron vialii TaxID=182163 RepID=UPI00265D8534|nr:growth-regulating factor 1-like [Rhododendron vialii]